MCEKRGFSENEGDKPMTFGKFVELQTDSALNDSALNSALKKL